MAYWEFPGDFDLRGCVLVGIAFFYFIKKTLKNQNLTPFSPNLIRGNTGDTEGSLDGKLPVFVSS